MGLLSRVSCQARKCGATERGGEGGSESESKREIEREREREAERGERGEKKRKGEGGRCRYVLYMRERERETTCGKNREWKANQRWRREGAVK